MRERLVVTDLAVMESRVCVAGYADGGRRSIRPVPLGGGGISWFALCTESGAIVEPFTEIEMNLREHRPDPPHTEDHIFQGAGKMRIVRRLHDQEAISLLETTRVDALDQIFGAEIVQSRFVRPGSGCASLGTIRVASIDRLHLGRDERYDRDRFDFQFHDAGGTAYRIRATDAAFREHCRRMHAQFDHHWDEAATRIRARINDAEAIFLRIGLSRPFQPRTRAEAVCYLMVTGVYTFPNYLDGRFADYYDIPGARPEADIESA